MSAASSHRPITSAEAARLFAGLAPEGPLALAVSGGSDSLALLYLVAPWARAKRREVLAVTVDHGLRPECADEARAVAAHCAALDVAHTILTWSGAKPRANLQAEARAARYALMEEWCRLKDICELVLAHTEDDQAETFLLRLARGSGVDGLSAMAPRAERRGLALVRPLLEVSRLRLQATLFAQGVRWLDDPSNRAASFARVRMRALMPVLAPEGLTRARLAATARRMGRARAALEAATDALLAQAAAVEDAGFVRLSVDDLARAPEEIGLRGLSRILRGVGGAETPLRLDSLERLYQSLAEEGLGRGRTLAGCRIVATREPGTVLVLREIATLPAEPLALGAGRAELWDGRFRVALATGPAGATVQALGAEGWARVKDEVASALPAAVRLSLPALWIAGRPAAVPHLSYIDRGAGLAPGSFAARFTGL